MAHFSFRPNSEIVIDIKDVFGNHGAMKMLLDVSAFADSFNPINAKAFDAVETPLAWQFVGAMPAPKEYA